MQNHVVDAQKVIRGALAGGGVRACLTCSFQAEDVAVLDLVRREQPRIPVLFLETGYHFPETLAYRDKLARDWDLNLIELANPLPVAAHEARFGELYRSDPGQCCHLRKVEPLMAGLEAYDVWITGLRREQSPTRRNLQVEEWHRLPSGKTLSKLSPLALWRWEEVVAYLAANRIPMLGLYAAGYTSIGCQPCTQKPTDLANPRSGRWGGQKLECGIHTFTQGA